MKSSKNNKKKAGSALLMVVGLLTILAMLGTTFLLVASLHKRASASLLKIRPLDDLAQGIVSQVANALLLDKYIGEISGTADYAPYAAAGPTGMYAEATATDGLLSNAGSVLFQTAQGAHVDTDGDGILDAYLYPTGVFNADGDEIYAAVKVVDLSSRIHVSTAYDKTAAAAILPVSPIKIGLKELVGTTAFNNLHSERCGTGSSTVQGFNDNCALVLSTSSGAGYKPFSIEDELFLRWLTPGAATNTGRLYTALGSFTGRDLLTTTARSRSILRNPEVHLDLTFKNRLLISSLSVLDGAEGTDNYKKRMWLLNQMYRALGLDVDAEGEATTIDDPSMTGGWWQEATGGYEGDFYSVDTSSPGSEVATYTFSGLTAGTDYKVAVTWTTDANPDNRPSDAPYTIKDDTTVEATVDVNQKVPGGDFEDGGVGWKNLGTYTIDSTTLIVELTNDADSYVSADAVRIIEVIDASEPEEPEAPADIIIDDQGAGASADPPGAGAPWFGQMGAYPNEYSGTTTNDQGLSKGSTFTFTPAIEVSGAYKVYMWWPTNDWYYMNPPNVPITINRFGGPDSTSVDQTVNGGQWNLLGTYNFDQGTDGSVVISTTGTDGFWVVADAVKFEFAGALVAIQPKHVEHWVANLWSYLSQLDPTANTFQVANAYGIVPQLVITEAYAYSIKETSSGAGDEGWAYAIELTNPTSVNVDASNYYLKCGALSWAFSAGSITTVTPGSKIVLYAYGGYKGAEVPRITAAEASDSFTTGGGWHQVTLDKGLDFAEANKDTVSIRVVRLVNSVEIPVDSVSGAEIGYDIVRDGTGAVTGDPVTPAVSIGQRDDDAARGRALVAVMRKTALSEATRKSGHRLGLSNGLTGDEAEFLGIVYKGFFIRSKPTQLGELDTKNLGELINRYIAGPALGTDPASDLPHQLADEAASFLRGRIDHNGAPPAVPQGYPAVAWPNVPGELLELVTPHTASSLIYGRPNINTAPQDVLAQLPWPTAVSEGTVNYTVTATDINGSGNANRITKAITDNRPYYTPGQVASVLASWVDSEKLNNDATRKSAGYIQAKYALYNAVSNSITVNSDTFAVYIRTQIGPNPKAGAHYHVAVIDRSNCSDNNDRPQVKMLAQVK